MKLLEFTTEQGGTVFINPDKVCSVVGRRGLDQAGIQLDGHGNGFTVKMGLEEVVARLRAGA